MNCWSCCIRGSGSAVLESAERGVLTGVVVVDAVADAEDVGGREATALYDEALGQDHLGVRRSARDGVADLLQHELDVVTDRDPRVVIGKLHGEWHGSGPGQH